MKVLIHIMESLVLKAGDFKGIWMKKNSVTQVNTDVGVNVQYMMEYNWYNIYSSEAFWYILH